MSDLEKIIKLVFEGDGTGLSREMKIVSKDFDDFSSKVQDATQPLADFGMKVATTEAALIALGAAGLVYAFSKAKEFETATIDLDKVLSDAESGGLAGAKQAAIDLADTYGISSTEVLRSIADFKQANFDLSDSIMLAEQAMRLKIAGDLEAAESSQFLKQILSGFSAEAKDSSLVIDTLNAVSNKYNTNVRELAVGMGDLSGVADLVNMSYAETAGVLTPVIAVFGSGSEAAQALKTGLIRLVDDTPAIVDAMASIGVTQYETNGKLKNAYDILGELSIAFENTDETQQLFIAGQIFGQMQASKMVQVIKDWDQVLAITETALNGVGSAQSEVDKRLASSEIAVNRLVVGWENLFVNIGARFSGSATGTINSLTDIENALRNSLGDETFDVIWNAVNSFFQDTETLLKQIAKNLPEALAGVKFSGLVESLRGLGVEVGEALDVLFGGELDLTTVKGLESAIQRVVDILTGMTNFTAGFIEGLNPLFTAIGGIAEKFGEMDEEGQTLAGNISGWAQSVNTLFSALDTFKDVLWAIAGIAGFNQVATFLSTLKAMATGGEIGILGKSLSALSLSVTGLMGAFAGLLGSGAIGWQFGRWIGELGGGTVDKAAQGFFEWTDEVLNWTGTQNAANKTAETAAKNIGEISNQLGTIPEYLKIEADTTSLNDLLSLPFLEEGLDTEIRLSHNVAALEKAQKQAAEVSGTKEMEIIGYFNGQPVYDEIKKLPTEETIEVKLTVQEQAKMDLERDLANIKETGENLRTAFEWSAKVDIADIEGAAKTTEAAFDAVGESVVAVSGSVSDMFGAMMEGIGGLSLGDKWAMMDILEDQQDAQNKLIDSMTELNRMQAENMRIRNEMLESGKTAEIKVDTTGLEPALEMVMWHFVDKVRIRVNESAQQFLLGFPA